MRLIAISLSTSYLCVHQALDLASGKLRGDIGGHWVEHHSPKSIAGNDAHELKALALAAGVALAAAHHTRAWPG